MTTEAVKARSERSRSRRALVRTVLLSLPVILACWIVVLAGVMRLTGDAPAAFVLFPSSDLLNLLPQDTAVTDITAVSVTLQSDVPDLTQRLYAAGAYLVLPGGLQGCIPAIFR